MALRRGFMQIIGQQSSSAARNFVAKAKQIVPVLRFPNAKRAVGKIRQDLEPQRIRFSSVVQGTGYSSWLSRCVGVQRPSLFRQRLADLRRRSALNFSPGVVRGTALGLVGVSFGARHVEGGQLADPFNIEIQGLASKIRGEDIFAPVARANDFGNLEDEGLDQHHDAGQMPFKNKNGMKGNVLGLNAITGLFDNVDDNCTSCETETSESDNGIDCTLDDSQVSACPAPSPMELKDDASQPSEEILSSPEDCDDISFELIDDPSLRSELEVGATNLDGPTAFGHKLIGLLPAGFRNGASEDGLCTDMTVSDIEESFLVLEELAATPADSVGGLVSGEICETENEIWPSLHERVTLKVAADVDPRLYCVDEERRDFGEPILGSHENCENLDEDQKSLMEDTRWQLIDEVELSDRVVCSYGCLDDGSLMPDVDHEEGAPSAFEVENVSGENGCDAIVACDGVFVARVESGGSSGLVMAENGIHDEKTSRSAGARSGDAKEGTSEMSLDLDEMWSILNENIYCIGRPVGGVVASTDLKEFANGARDGVLDASSELSQEKFFMRNCCGTAVTDTEPALAASYSNNGLDVAPSEWSVSDVDIYGATFEDPVMLMSKDIWCNVTEGRCYDLCDDGSWVSGIAVVRDNSHDDHMVEMSTLAVCVGNGVNEMSSEVPNNETGEEMAISDKCSVSLESYCLVGSGANSMGFLGDAFDDPILAMSRGIWVDLAEGCVDDIRGEVPFESDEV